MHSFRKSQMHCHGKKFCCECIVSKQWHGRPPGRGSSCSGSARCIQVLAVNNNKKWIMSFIWWSTKASQKGIYFLFLNETWINAVMVLLLKVLLADPFAERGEGCFAFRIRKETACSSFCICRALACILDLSGSCKAMQQMWLHK